MSLILFLMSHRLVRDIIYGIVLLLLLLINWVFPHVSAALAVAEPSTYKEASGILEWQNAMSEELAALDRTGTWEIVPLPSHAVPITCK